MNRYIQIYFLPFVGRILFWSALILVFVKLLLPQAGFQAASLLNNLKAFDSREIIRITNEVRALNNLPPLAINSKLDLAASEKYQDMAKNEYFAHVSPNGINPWFWVKKADYNYSVAGENLAIGFFNAKDTVEAWLNSPSHKANLLNNKYKEIGVAVGGAEINDRKGILIVQMFGSPATSAVKTTSAPKNRPAPSLSPAPTPEQSTTVTAPPSLVLAETGEIVTIQHISTDTIIEPLIEPLPVKFDDVKNIRKISKTLNNVFSVYALIIAILSVTALAFLERSRGMVLKTAASTAIFIISVLIPAASITFEGLIF